MEVEILHSTKGDKKKSIDTKTEAGRGEAHALLQMLSEQKCAVFLERGKQTYRVVGYDPKMDKLIVEAGKGKKQKLIATAGYKAKCAAVAPVAGGAGNAMRFEVRNEEAEAKLREIGGMLKASMPQGFGFTVLVFSYGDAPGQLFYLSSAQREDMIATMREFIKKYEAN